MVTPHRVHHDLYGGSKDLADPGDAGEIRVSEDLQICEMVSARAETRTLIAPSKPGIRLILRALTAVGAITVTAAEGFNVAGETEATFGQAADFLSLISVTTSTGFRWEIMEGNVGVTVAA